MSEVEYNDCPTCDGTGEVPVKDYFDQCPTCKGQCLIVVAGSPEVADCLSKL